ncbi:cytochrome P450 [Xylaria intraflava]|nr:cytochrome P450 [Xylaria intraflava]
MSRFLVNLGVLQSTMSPWLWTGLLVTVLVLALRIKYKSSVELDKSQPQRLGHFLPFIGHALKLASDKKKFFIESLQKFNQQPFSMLIAGRRHYVFADLADVGAIHKNEDIGFRWPKLFVYTHLLGFSKKDAELMWDIDREAERIDHKWLLGREEQAVTTSAYFHLVEKHMDHLDSQVGESDSKSLKVDGLLTVINVEGTATVETFYGPTTVQRNPRIIEDMIYVVTKGFKPFLFEIPRFLAPNAHNARDRIINSFIELNEELETRKDISGYFIERYRYLNEQGAPPRAVGADMFRHLFASLLNSLPTTYLALVHILKSPELTEKVRQELKAARYADLSPAERVQILPERAPLLRSIWFETLRLHNNLVTLRHVEQDTRLSTRPEWLLYKDRVISIPAAPIHYDAKLHPDPNEFQPGRFMDKVLGGGGENAGRTLKPFGGGVSYCPGRAFGEKQMMGFIAALITRFDVRIIEQDFPVPPNGDFDDLWARPRCHWEITRRSAC